MGSLPQSWLFSWLLSRPEILGTMGPASRPSCWGSAPTPSSGSVRGEQREEKHRQVREWKPTPGPSHLCPLGRPRCCPVFTAGSSRVPGGERPTSQRRLPSRKRLKPPDSEKRMRPLTLTKPFVRQNSETRANKLILLLKQTYFLTTQRRSVCSSHTEAKVI